jgi:hypothetical protein
VEELNTKLLRTARDPLLRMLGQTRAFTVRLRFIGGIEDGTNMLILLAYASVSAQSRTFDAAKCKPNWTPVLAIRSFEDV